MKQIKTLKKTKITLLSAFLASSLLFANCEFGSQSDSNDDAGLLVTLLALDNQAKAAAAEAAKQCTFNYNTETGGFQELCKPSNPITNQVHYRIEDLAIDTNNAYFWLHVGFNETPANLPINSSGSGRFSFFNGPSSSTTPVGNPISQTRFNGISCGESNNCAVTAGGFGTTVASWELSTVTTGTTPLPNRFG
ncbi:MAG: hypothetical protein JJT78_08485, partial [Leptospira sp.]|nr:hypothetical protein [Leptospira sp.]